MKPKGISVLIGFVLVVVVSITAVTLVLIFGQNIISQAQDSGVVSEATQNINTLDAMIQQVASEGPGTTLSTQLRSSGGTYRVDNISGTLEFSYPLKSNFLSTGVFKQQGSLTTEVVGQSVSTSQFSVPTNGLVGYWKLDEGYGTTTTDSSGNGNTGTLINSPQWLSGNNCKFGNCLNFTSSNQQMTASMSVLNSLSITAWFNYYSNYSNYGVIGGYENNSAINPSFLIDANLNAPNPYIDYYNATDHACSFGTQQIGKWNFYVLTYNSQTGIMSAYLNGLFICSVSGIVAPTFSAPTFNIGNNGGLNGTIDDVRIYNRALSAGEIQQIYNAEGENSGYVLDNGILHVIMQQIGNSTNTASINTSSLIQSIEIKSTGQIFYPTDTSVIIGNYTNSSWGVGYTQLSQQGTLLTQSSVVAYVQSNLTGTNYEVQYILPSGTDFIEVKVVNVTSTNQTTMNLAFHIAPNETNDLIRVDDNSGLIGYWKLDEGTGTTTADSSGNGATLSLGGATWTTSNCKFNYCLNFTQSGGASGSSGSFGNVSFPYTLSWWMNAAITSGSNTRFFTFNTNNAVVDTNTGSGSTYQIRIPCGIGGCSYGGTGSVFNDNQLYNFVLVFNSSCNANLYVNGTFYSSIGCGSYPWGIFSAINRLGGNGGCTSGCNFAGTIDDVRIYNRSLSSNEIQQIYNDGESVFTTDQPAPPATVCYTNPSKEYACGYNTTGTTTTSASIIYSGSSANFVQVCADTFNPANYKFNITSTGPLSVVMPVTNGACSDIENKVPTVQSQGTPAGSFENYALTGQKAFDLLLSYDRIELQGNLRIGSGTFQICVQKTGVDNGRAVVSVTTC